MQKIFSMFLLALVTLVSFGCATDHYNIPHEMVEKKVKVVGVAPILTDAESDLRHPDRESLVKLVRTYNAKNEKELVARLRESGAFYTVRPLQAEPTELFQRLVANRERRDDAGIVYNKYFYKRDEVKQILAANGFDAVMLVTVSGLTKRDKKYASNYLSYLETDFNYLAMSAQLLDSDGNTVWEYPNFRQRALSYPMLLDLQYPDFDEATANLSEKVDVKFKTIPGISAALAKSKPSEFPNGGDVSELYSSQFGDMISLIKPSKPLFGGKKETAAPPAAGAPAAPAK